AGPGRARLDRGRPASTCTWVMTGWLVSTAGPPRLSMPRPSPPLRTARVRADTTVISANVAYPTDVGLLAKAVGKLVRPVRRVQAAGGATGTVMTDRRRAAARRAREMTAQMRARGKLGNDQSTAAIRRVSAGLADLAEKTAAEAAAVLRNGRRALPRALSGRVRGRLRRALAELAGPIGPTRPTLGQAPTPPARPTPPPPPPP